MSAVPKASDTARLTRMTALRPDEGMRKEVRDSGLKVTLPRLAVLRVLRAAKGPMTHGEVWEALVAQGLDKATVYRNLLDLARVGLARRSDLGDHAWRFEAAKQDSARRDRSSHGEAVDEHAHFVCNECGTVECLDEVTVQTTRSTRVPRSLRKQQVEILVKGRCDSCD